MVNCQENYLHDIQIIQNNLKFIIHVSAFMNKISIKILN